MSLRRMFYVATILLNIIALFIPKNLSEKEIYATTVFALFIGTNVDLLLGKYFSLYSYFEEGVELKVSIGQYLYFIPINILFLNYYL